MTRGRDGHCAQWPSVFANLSVQKPIARQPNEDIMTSLAFRLSALIVPVVLAISPTAMATAPSSFRNYAINSSWFHQSVQPTIPPATRPVHSKSTCSLIPKKSPLLPARSSRFSSAMAKLALSESRRPSDNGTSVLISPAEQAFPSLKSDLVDRRLTLPAAP